MHQSVGRYVEGYVRSLGLAGRSVLEVGSYNVNGTVRDYFSGAYLGVDMQAGPGVDQVALARALPFGDESFAVVVSTEMLEHDPTPWLSVAEMARGLQPDGYLILTARGYDERGVFPLHDYPGDYWRYSTGGFTALLVESGLEPVDVRTDPEAPGVLSVARKARVA